MYTPKGTFSLANIKNELNVNPVFNRLEDSQKIAIINSSVNQVSTYRLNQNKQDFRFDTTINPVAFSSLGTVVELTEFNSGDFFSVQESGGVKSVVNHTPEEVRDILPGPFKSLTRSQLQTSIASSGLKAGQFYFINDKNVILQAISENKLSTSGKYLFYGGSKAWGCIAIGPGSTGFGVASGSIDSVTIDGVNIMANSVNCGPYTIPYRFASGSISSSMDAGILELAQGVADSISGSEMGYTAYAIANFVVIESNEIGTAANGKVISGTSTGLSLINAVNMLGGSAPLASPLVFDCTYDYSSNVFTRIYDPVYDNEVSGTTTVFNFPWGNSRVTNNRLRNTQIQPFFVGSSASVKNNTLTDCTFGNSLCIGASKIINNTATKAQITHLALNGSKARIQSFIINGGGPTDDWTVDDYARVDYIYTACNIEGIRMQSSAWLRYLYLDTHCYGIYDMEIGAVSSVINIYIPNSGTYGARIFSNKIYGRAMLGNLILRDTAKIYNNVFADDFTGLRNLDITGGYINSNYWNNTFTFVGAASTTYYLWNNVRLVSTDLTDSRIDKCTLTNVTLYGWKGINCYISDLTLTGPGTGITITMDGQRYERNILIRVPFDGVNIGVAGQSYYLVNLGSAGEYIQSGFVETSGLTGGASAAIQLGFLADDPNAILASTAITTLNNKLNTLSPAATKTTENFRKINLTINTANVTGGIMVIHLKCFYAG